MSTSDYFKVLNLFVALEDFHLLEEDGLQTVYFHHPTNIKVAIGKYNGMIIWSRYGPDRKYWAYSFEKILDFLPPKIQTQLLFHLDVLTKQSVYFSTRKQ